LSALLTARGGYYKRIITLASNNLFYFWAKVLYDNITRNKYYPYIRQWRILKNHSIFVSLHHGSLIVEDLARSLDFYCYVIGLKQNLHRPKMSFDGAWLDVGEQQIHLLNLAATEQSLNQPEHAGRDRHLALHVREIKSIKANLEANDIFFTMSKSGREALFCRDPDGNGLEFIKI